MGSAAACLVWFWLMLIQATTGPVTHQEAVNKARIAWVIAAGGCYALQPMTGLNRYDTRRGQAVMLSIALGWHCGAMLK